MRSNGTSFPISRQYERWNNVRYLGSFCNHLILPPALAIRFFRAFGGMGSGHSLRVQTMRNQCGCHALRLWLCQIGNHQRPPPLPRLHEFQCHFIQLGWRSERNCPPTVS